MATTLQKCKTVQNYILQSISYLNPDQSQVWLARHKILKKSYMLKRVKYLKETVSNVKGNDGEDEGSALNLQKIVREIELLKHIKLAGTPKCQKMIKTTNCLYVVYDQFVGTPLADFFKTPRSYEQKLNIMIKLGKTLLSYHVKEIIFLLLCPNNIFVQQNQNLFFSEWSLAIYKNNTKNIFPINNTTQSIFIANEVIQESKCSFQADIFSLGQIYYSIINNTQPIQDGLNKLIQKMIDTNARHRPSLQQIIQSLQSLLKESTLELPIKSKLTQSKPLHKTTKLQRSRLKRFATEIRQGEIEVSREKNKDVCSEDKLFRQKSSRQTFLSRAKLSTGLSFDNILTGMSRTLSKVDASRVKSNDALVRKINKHRNLSYFIMDLSQFASNKAYGQELGYVLLKQSYLILNNCYIEWNNQDLQDKKSIKLTNILKDQIVQLNLSLNMLKEYFLSQQKICPQLKTQLRSDLSINEKYLKEKTLAFCNEIIKQINLLINENKVQSLNHLVNQLFSTYMLLKSIEEGTYQKYWDKIYTPQVAFLKNQKYFNEQKKLGYRYLKSKITQILNKK